MSKPNFEDEWPVLMEVAKQYELDADQTTLLLAMRQAENGPEGFEFGVKAARDSSLRTQAEWAAGSIKKNVSRYENFLAQPGAPSIDFIEFMGYHGGPVGKGWAPIVDVPDAERDLNKNWVPNVRSIVDRLQNREE